LGEEEEAGIGSFVLDLGFHCRAKEKATQMSRWAASVRRSRLCLVPFVIDLTRKAISDKNINRSDGPGEKRGRENYGFTDRTGELHGADADSLRSRVG
jgi:hypothetical protein